MDICRDCFRASGYGPGAVTTSAGDESGDRDGAEGASGAQRLTAPAEARAPRLPFPVVGIGASAGGLEAFTEFLQAAPADSGMACDHEFAAVLTRAAAIIISRDHEADKRARTEAALQASEDQYRTLFDSMDEGYCIIQMLYDAAGAPVDWRYLEVNPAFERHNGLAGATGRTIRELSPDIEPKWAEIYGRVAATGESRRFVEGSPALGGRVFDLFAVRVGDPDERKVAVLFTNITERVRAEAALRESEERYRELFESIDEGFCTVEMLLDDAGAPVDYKFLIVNPAFARQTGRYDLVGRTVRDALPLHAEHWPALYGDVARTGEPRRFERLAEDQGRSYEVHAWRVGEPEQRRVAVLFNDITDRRQAEATARQANERLHLALVAARMGIWSLDTATGTHVRDANLNRLLGLDPVETTLPFTEFLGRVHADDRDGVATAFAASIRDGEPLSVEFRVVRPDGAVRWLRDQGDVFADAVRGRQHMAGACMDVTERREAQEAVRAGEERLRLILAGATDYAIYTLAEDGRITSWSSGAAATFGYTEAEILGSPVDALFTPEDRAAGAPRQELDAALRVGRADDERWHLRRDGARFYASGVLTRLATGGYVKVARDLTDRKRTEDALRDAHDRLEERVGERTAELAAAVRSLEAESDRRRALALQLSNAQEEERKRVSRDLHDTVGQTHVALSLALTAALRSVPPGSEAAERLTYAVHLADGMGRELHDTAVRLRPVALDDLGLAAALSGLVSTWSRQHETPVELAADVAGRLPIEVETALYRLVQEALTNVARHARATSVDVVVTRQPGLVTAVVEDDGVGFDPESVGAARLGLRGMRERVALIGGELLVESKPGAGTCLVARVPLR